MDHREALPTGMLLDGSYRIMRVVGSGGFAITYEAEDVNLDTVVAIKEYYPFDFGQRAGTMSVRPKSNRHERTFDWGRSNFLKEARTLARFEHSSIVRVTRVFEANSTAYMVMRFERGKSFEDWLKELGRLPTQEELDRIVAPLLEALQMLHAAEFLHRDIAPDNIIVRADGTPVLLDFGAARRAVVEMSGVVTGIVKAGYSPHEQYSSNGRLQGPWSDVYALGGTLYRAVAGRAPEEAALRVDEDRMPPAAEIGRGRYRPGFLAAIDACLKVRPSQRPRSVTELRPMLLEGEKASSFNRLVMALKPAREPRSLQTAAASRATSSVRPSPTRRRPTIVVGIVAILGGAYVGYEYTLLQPTGRGVADTEKRGNETEAAARRQVEQAAEIRRKEAEKEASKRQAALDAEKRRKDVEAAARLDAEKRRKDAEEASKRQAALDAEKRRKEAEETAKLEEEKRRKEAEREASKRQAALDAEKRRKAEIEEERARRSDKLFKDCDMCPHMVPVPPGEYLMGSSKADIDFECRRGQ